MTPCRRQKRDDSLLHVQRTLGKKELVPCERFDLEVEAESIIEKGGKVGEREYERKREKHRVEGEMEGRRERENGKVKVPRSYSPICKVVYFPSFVA